jgi:transposase InsO family protein
MDLYSRKIVGWSMDTSMKASLVNDAITMALWQRRPTKGLIWHTDRGSQYCSNSHREILKDHRVLQSMSRTGDCWDNATSESFFGILKRELVQLSNFTDQKQAAAAIFEYIEVFYNKVRAHSTIGYIAPDQFEDNQILLQKIVL